MRIDCIYKIIIQIIIQIIIVIYKDFKSKILLIVLISKVKVCTYKGLILVIIMALQFDCFIFQFDCFI